MDALAAGTFRPVPSRRARPGRIHWRRMWAALCGAAALTFPSVGAAEPAARLLADLDEPPPPELEWAVAGLELGRVVLTGPAGRIAVMPERGQVEPAGEGPTDAAAVDGGFVFVRGGGVWRTDGTRDGTRLLAHDAARELIDVEVGGGVIYVRAVQRAEVFRVDETRPPGSALVSLRAFSAAPIGPMTFAAGRLWFATDSVRTQTLRALAPDGRLTSFQSPRRPRALYGVREIENRVVLVTDRGILRVEDDELVPVWPELALGSAEFDVALSDGSLWARADRIFVSTDGTADGTASFAISEGAVGAVWAPLARDRVAVMVDDVLEVRDASGAVLRSVLDVRSWVASAGMLFAVVVDTEDLILGAPRELSRRFVRIDVEGDDRVLEDLALEPPLETSVLPTADRDGVWLVDRAPGELVRIRRWQSDGALALEPFVVPWTRFAPPGADPLLVLETGEVVLGAPRVSPDAPLRGVALVAPAVDGAAPEPLPSSLLGSDGTHLFGRDLRGTVGFELWRWSPRDGLDRIRNFDEPARLLRGIEGRPFVIQGSEIGSGEPLQLWQVSADGQAEPVFDDLPDAGTGISALDVRADGVWALFDGLDDEQEVLQWSFETNTSQTRWTGPRRPLTDLWVVGDSAAPWLVGSPSPGGFDLLRLDNREELPEFDVRIPGGADAPVRVPARSTLGFVRAGQLFRFAGGTVEPVATSFDVGRVVRSGPALYWVGESLRGPGAPSGRELAAIGGNASVPELVPGPLGSAPGAVTPLPDGAGVVFHAWTADHGRELWVSERSTGRTQRVCDFQPGPTPGIPDGTHLAVGDDAVYAMAFVEGVGTVPVEVPMAVIRGDVECGVGVPGEIREDAPLAPSGDPTGCSCRTQPEVDAAVPSAALAIAGAALSSRRRRRASQR